TAVTSRAGTKRNVGSGSMNRAISHGQAIRSTRAFARVTHFMSCLPRTVTVDAKCINSYIISQPVSSGAWDHGGHGRGPHPAIAQGRDAHPPRGLLRARADVRARGPKPRPLALQVRGRGPARVPVHRSAVFPGPLLCR